MRTISKSGYVSYLRWRPSPHSNWSLPLLSNLHSTRHFSFRKTTIEKSSKRRWPGLMFAILIVSGGVGFALISNPSQPSTLNPQTFTPFILESKEAVSSTCSIFRLTPSAISSSIDQYKNTWKRGIWSVQIKQPQLQIARAYTPLPPTENESDKPNTIRFLIRHDDRGELSSYLHKLPLHTPVDLRGPRMEYKIPEDIDEILFLAGGTGIAPALQTAYTIFKIREPLKGKPLPKMRILWANRTQEDCLGAISQEDSSTKSLLGRLLNTLFGRVHTQSPITPATNPPQSPLIHQLSILQKTYHPNLQISYFIDSNHTFITPAVLKRHLHTVTLQDPIKQNEKKKLILISGPEGFVNYLAGPKQWRGGSEVQGPLEGVLGTMALHGWKVWKL